MQVQVHDVHAEVARPRPAHQRVHVRAVAVDQAALLVDDAGRRADLVLEHPERVRVGEHQRRDVGRHRLGERRHRQVALRAGLDLAHLVAAEMRAGRVRAVGRVGNQHDLARGAVAGDEMLADHHHPGQFPVRARRGLKRDSRQAGDLAEHLGGRVQQGQRALRDLVGRHRVQVREPAHPRGRLVHLRVVLHRARPERVHARVHAVVPGGQPREVAHQAHFRHLRETRPGPSRSSPSGTAPSSGADGMSRAGSE